MREGATNQRPANLNSNFVRYTGADGGVRSWGFVGWFTGAFVGVFVGYFEGFCMFELVYWFITKKPAGSTRY